MRIEEMYLTKYKECCMKIRKLIKFIEKNGYSSAIDDLIPLYISDFKNNLFFYNMFNR